MTDKPRIKKSDSKALSPKERIAKLEKQIAEGRALLATLKPGRGAGLTQQLPKWERLLEIEKVHRISKFNNIKHRVVSGCYGSGRRTN
jgi:hypothetical protein